VVQGAGSIEARLAGDGRSSLSQGDESGNVPYPVVHQALKVLGPKFSRAYS
jgi:hypothetical protein